MEVNKKTEKGAKVETPTSNTYTKSRFSYFEYLAFYLVGICYLSSWNVFISAHEYVADRLEGITEIT